MSVYLLTKHDQIGVFKKIAACIETPSSKVVLFTEPTELDIALNLLLPMKLNLCLWTAVFFRWTYTIRICIWQKGQGLFRL